jgi:hypothetical protein
MLGLGDGATTTRASEATMHARAMRRGVAMNKIVVSMFTWADARRMKRRRKRYFYELRTIRNRMVQLVSRKRNPVKVASSPASEWDYRNFRFHGACSVCKNLMGAENPCGNPCDDEYI